VKYGKDAAEKFNVAIGRYVIMPDHIHLFVRGDSNFALSPWVGGLKRAISLAVSQPTRLPLQGRHSQAARPFGYRSGQSLPPQGKRVRRRHACRYRGKQNSLWQPGFFDHVLRSDESYAQKWEYVRDNPVRAGLVASWEEWPHQGEITLIDPS
jgi:REP element-mobilizing transposase RayT